MCCVPVRAGTRFVGVHTRADARGIHLHRVSSPEAAFVFPQRMMSLLVTPEGLFQLGAPPDRDPAGTGGRGPACSPRFTGAGGCSKGYVRTIPHAKGTKGRR